MKSLCSVIIFLITMASCHSALAYRLPAYEISSDERSKSAEEVLSGYRARRDEIGDEVNLSHLDERGRNPRFKLTRGERGALAGYNKVMRAIAFWNSVVSLKGDLEALHGNTIDRVASAEADAIAKIVIEVLHDLSQRWRVGSSALLRNLMINIGAKSDGFCYHYVEALRDALARHGWKEFDLHWGVAWKGDFRENNSLVVTAKGEPFEEGLAIDAWRTAGRPYWTAVKGDRFPWKKEFDIQPE